MQDTQRSADALDELKTRIAWLYHIEGMTQDEVARALGLNRSRVLRVLAAARRDGTVQIRVTSRLSRCVELERELEAGWGLARAIVVPEPHSPERIPSMIGAELGALVSQTVRSGMTIGLGWGKTLSAGLASIEPREPDGVRVVSMLGGLTRVSATNPSEFAWRVADRLSAECHLMAAPVFAPSRETRDALVGHPGISEIFDRAVNIDLAIVSVGELTPHSTFAEYGLLTADEIVSLESAGVVGDVLCHFIDGDGNVIDHPVNERVLALHPYELRRSRNVVLASGGWSKLAALRGALRTLRPSVLITNERVAERLAREGAARSQAAGRERLPDVRAFRT